MAKSPPCPFLLLLIGAPGTGKSYLASRLAERLRATLVQTDAIRKRLFVQPAYSRTESAAVYREAHQLIEAGLDAGEVVVFDATNLREGYRRTLYRIAERSNARVHLVWLSTPEAVVAQRLHQRQVNRDPSNLSDATWATYRKMARRAEAPRRPFTVLNAVLPADEQVALLERVMGRQACG